MEGWLSMPTHFGNFEPWGPAKNNLSAMPAYGLEYFWYLAKKNWAILKFIVLFLGNITEEMVHLLPCEHRKDWRQAAENLPGVLYRERATLQYKGTVWYLYFLRQKNTVL